MKITLLGPTSSDPSKSMNIYPLNLLKSLRETGRQNVYELIRPKTTRFPLIKDILAKEIIYPTFIDKSGTDIFHITDHSYGSLAFSLPKTKTIITCHDLNAMEILEQSSKLGRLRFNFNIQALYNCAQIIAISEYTKKTILKYLNITTPITITGLGFDDNIFYFQPSIIKAAQKKYSPDKNKIYLLHVGHSNPVKNVEMILEALTKLPKQYHLIKVGRFTDLQEKFIQKHKIDPRIDQYLDINTDELVKIYHAAQMLVFPSFLEGFGMPIVEAMACGLPVITSDCSAMPETGGEAALYTNPRSIDTFLKAIEQLSNDNNLKRRNTKLGFAQAQKFTWTKCALKTRKVYESIKETT